MRKKVIYSAEQLSFTHGISFTTLLQITINPVVWVFKLSFIVFTNNTQQLFKISVKQISELITSISGFVFQEKVFSSHRIKNRSTVNKMICFNNFHCGSVAKAWLGYDILIPINACRHAKDFYDFYFRSKLKWKNIFDAWPRK